jgi:hypothetical protein
MSAVQRTKVKSGEREIVKAPEARPKVKATTALRPSVNAALVIASYTKKPLDVGDAEIGELMDALADAAEHACAGDTKRAEAMLFGQAHALQAIFMNLARRATIQEYMKNWEAYLRMALKAQNQCRMTLETLATIKNPPVVFARQANINNGGNQQVNNGTDPLVPVNADEVHAAGIAAGGLLPPGDAPARLTNTAQVDGVNVRSSER